MSRLFSWWWPEAGDAEGFVRAAGRSMLPYLLAGSAVLLLITTAWQGLEWLHSVAGGWEGVRQLYAELHAWCAGHRVWLILPAASILYHGALIRRMLIAIGQLQLAFRAEQQEAYLQATCRLDRLQTTYVQFFLLFMCWLCGAGLQVVFLPKGLLAPDILGTGMLLVGPAVGLVLMLIPVASLGNNSLETVMGSDLTKLPKLFSGTCAGDDSSVLRTRFGLCDA